MPRDFDPDKSLENRGNTVCISCFLNCIAGAKDSAAAEDDLFRGSLAV